MSITHMRSLRGVTIIVTLAVIVMAGAIRVTTAESAKVAKPKLGMLLALTGIPFSAATSDGGKDGAKAAGASLTITGPPTIDPTTALKNFSDLAATKPNGVVVFPIPADLWAKPLRDAQAKGIKIAAIHVPLPTSSKVPLYVGMREKEAASKLAEVVAKKLGKSAKGEIVLGIGPAGEPVNENRILGYKETLKRLLPNVKVTGPLTTGNEPTANRAAWTQIFNRYPDALAYLGTTDQDSGSLAYLKRTRGGDTLVGAFDPSKANGALQAIASGRMLAAVGQQPYIRGYIATRVLGEASKAGVPVPKGWFDTGIEIVTKSNVTAIGKRDASLAATRSYYKARIAKWFGKGLSGLPLKPLKDVALAPVPKS